MADSRTITALRKQNVAEASFHPDGSLASVKFFAPEPAEPKKTAAQQASEKPRYFQGTNVVDDGKPLNPLDTLLNPPKYDPSEVDA